MLRSAWTFVVQIVLCAALYTGIVLLHHDPAPHAGLAAPQWTYRSLDEPAHPPQPLHFPHHWPVERAKARTVLYVGQFSMSATPAKPWALYIRSLGGDAVVSINGAIVGDAQLGHRHRFHPLMYTIPQPLLQAGDNRVSIELREDPPGAGFLDDVLIGPYDVIEPLFQHRWNLKIGFPSVAAVAAMVVGTLTFMLWMTRPKEFVFLWYALSCFCGSAYAMFLLVTLPPLQPPWWDTLLVLNIVWFGITVGVIGMSYLDKLDPPFMRAQLRLLALASVLLLGAAALLDPQFLRDWVLPLALLVDMLGGVFLIGVFTFRQTKRMAGFIPFWMTLSALLLAAVSVHDNLLLMGFSYSWLSPSDGLYFTFAAALTLVTCTFILLNRYQTALTEAEILNNELSDRVAAREAQVEQSYRELRRADQDRAIAAERERIFADMHDGLGGTLISALARLDIQGQSESESARALREALSDLRLMLSSLAPGENSPGIALALLRDRLQPHCDDAGVQLDFDLQHIPETLHWPPTALLQLLRIVQEACTNALRHARPQSLNLVARVEGDQFLVSIEDDGVGFDPATSSSAGHHGLGTMTRRAESLDGHIAWSRLEPGTRVHLRLRREQGEGD